MINQLSYAQEQEGGNQQPSVGLQRMCNYVLNRYASKDPKNFPQVATLIYKFPCEMFLHDCLFNKPLCEIMTNLRSDDPDKKKQAKEIIACMQQELKKRIAIFTKFVKTKNEEKRRESMFWLKAGLCPLAGFFGFTFAKNHSSSNFALNLGVLLCLSGIGGCVGASVSSFLPDRVTKIIKLGCQEMKKLSGLLDELVAHKG